jgi:hypothetical protein
MASTTVKERMELFEKLNKDIKAAASSLSDNEARYLVDTYYTVQKYRITSSNQIGSMDEEPNDILRFFLGDFETLENQLKLILGAYAKSKPIGRWLLDIKGIGPVIAAGLIAYIDISRVQTAGQIQAYAGLDPTKKWEKGQKRPWNAKLKVLCWKAGQSFVKVSNRDGDIYGHIYREKKEYYNKKNEEGGFAERAAQILKEKKLGKETDAYKAYSAGKLPAAHIEAMAERFAVKIFISHLFTVWYEMEHGTPAPKPYAEAILNHAHIIAPPSYDDWKKYMD